MAGKPQDEPLVRNGRVGSVDQVGTKLGTGMARAGPIAGRSQISGMERVLVCGQTSVDADGQPLHEGDMGAQVGQALDNLESVLGEAGFALADVVRMNYFVTDVDAFIQAGEIYGARLAEAGCRPASTLLGVSRLALPPLLVEIEATAAK